MFVCRCSGPVPVYVPVIRLRAGDHYSVRECVHEGCSQDGHAAGLLDVSRWRTAAASSLPLYLRTCV